MKDLEIKLFGRQSFDGHVVTVDGNEVKFKKDERGLPTCNYQTENDRATIKVYRMLDVGGALWFITQLFFFLISVFGIFDIHRREKCLVADFETEIELSEVNKVTLQLNPPREGTPAVAIQSTSPFDTKANNYFLDVKAKKLLKGLLAAKIILAVAIVAAVVLVALFVL